MALQKENFDTLQQVKINIPFLDAIKQIPSNAKFLKDLCTMKRKLNVKETTFLTNEVSAIINPYTPIKYKDPGCPTIPIVVGNCTIGRALLNLGASVNLLPYFIYQQLGLGELKPTRTVLQMVDRSVRTPRGVVEDVLVHVEKFFYSVDFIVLDTHVVPDSTKQIPVVLGHPFLATANVVINCWDGILKLSFGNMKTEMIVFEVCKKPDESKNDFEEVDFIQMICYEHFEMEVIERKIRKHILAWKDSNVKCEKLESMYAVRWEPQFEPLETPSSKAIPSNEKAPTLERKSLHKELKYDFLGDGKAFPVVISATVSSIQEDALFKVLFKHRQAIGWSIADLKEISLLICSHRIYLEDEAKPMHQMQSRHILS